MITIKDLPPEILYKVFKNFTLVNKFYKEYFLSMKRLDCTEFINKEEANIFLTKKELYPTCLRTHAFYDVFLTKKDF